MADILFIMPRFEGVDGEPIRQNSGPPLPFLWLGAVLEPAGYSVKIIDAGLHTGAKKLIAAELDKKPLFAGFYGHVGRSVRSLIELSSFVRDHSPGIPVVHGGVLPSMNPELTLAEHFVDIVVAGEGEETVLELAAALKEGKPVDDIRGIAYKKDGRPVINPARPLLDMDSLPMPAWHLIDSDIGRYMRLIGYEKDGTPVSGIHLVSSKGCPANCSFCFSRRYQKRYRCKSAQKTLDEIEHLVNNYNVKNFYFQDEDFMINRKRVLEFFKGLENRGLDIKFTCQTRVDTIDGPLLRTASRAGLTGLSFGVEFCTEDALESYKKKIGLEQVFDAAAMCAENNVLSHFNLICGYPAETYGDMMATVKVAEKLRKINPFSQFLLYVYTPNYGTDEFEELEEKYGFYPGKLADCEWLHWSTVKNRKWIRDPSLCENFFYLFTFCFQLNSGDLPAIYRSSLLRKWAYLRLRGPFLGFAPEIRLFKLVRRLR